MNTPPVFVLPLGELDAGGRPFEFTISRDWLEAALADTDASPAQPDGSLKVRASKSGNDVVVHGTLAAAVETPCARCLQPAHVSIDEKVSYLFVPAGGAGTKPKRGEDGDLSFEEEEADVFPFTGESVPLDDVVRDEILLAIPMIPLCSEDCPGIAPGSLLTHSTPSKSESTGTRDGPVDPRLLPLLKLKNLSKSKKE